ncbi:hypothetical protein E2C01_040796 [Portunus trituberculatus]|uniref:Uncharacterized protein n=1 Tax=Portunus trituberculatus TaxID=210409 RepID=A0A5B7FKQ3_PORTR|nr:hypothetical protein [Portunus trituberculatus]
MVVSVRNPENQRKRESKGVEIGVASEGGGGVMCRAVNGTSVTCCALEVRGEEEEEEEEKKKKHKKDDKEDEEEEERRTSNRQR